MSRNSVLNFGGDPRPRIVREDEALWDWNLKSGRIHFSPRWLALVGADEHEVGIAPDEWFGRVHPEDRDRLTRAIADLRESDATDFEWSHRLRHASGTYRWTMCRGVVTRDRDGVATTLCGAHEDVTASTVTDSLTGLPNRLLLLDRMTRALEAARHNPGVHCAVLAIDLGRHDLADTVAIAVARRLETAIRPAADDSGPRDRGLVARISDDRFAVLLEALKEVGEAKAVADRLLAHLLTPLVVGGSEVLLPASIGIAISTTGYALADDMLRDADSALHRARVLGGSHCELFDTTLLRAAEVAQALERDLKDAIEQEEFQLYYQPIVSLATRRVVGFEALARWRHPKLGLVSPGDFIAVAERTGLIVPLGSWILRTACAQLRAWRRELPSADDLSVSVNLSPLQLQDAALVDTVADALSTSGLEPHGLTLELTESLAMENPTAVRSLLMRLRATGVRISIDDFGTGYSSLSHLRQFPVDVLKIDRAFVRGLDIRSDLAAIVESVTAMTRQLGLQVVAEGIETESQAAVLRSLQCETGQGYLFAEPLAVERATELLRTGLPMADARRAAKGRGASAWSQRRWAYVAAAFLIVVTAGIVRYGKVSDTPPAPQPQMSKPGVAPTPVSALRSAAPVAAPVKAPVAAPATRPVNAPAKPVVQEQKPLTVPVHHQHRVGSCEGSLVVSRTGLAFMPSDDSGKDAVTLSYGEFLSSMDDQTLTIKTSDRTYRFKADKGPGQSGMASLQDAFQEMARLR